MKIEDAIKQKKFDNPQQKAWLNIIYTFNHINDKIGDIFKQFDITSQQYNVLRILKGRHPEGGSCASVKEVMLDKNPDLTRLCDRLLSKGYIQREVNENNRRQVELKITSEGLDLLKRINPIIKKSAQVLHTISDKEAEKLSTLLDKLRG